MDLDPSEIVVPGETQEAIDRMHTNFDIIRAELVAANVTLEDIQIFNQSI